MVFSRRRNGWLTLLPEKHQGLGHQVGHERLIQQAPADEDSQPVVVLEYPHPRGEGVHVPRTTAVFRPEVLVILPFPVVENFVQIPREILALIVQVVLGEKVRLPRLELELLGPLAVPEGQGVVDGRYPYAQPGEHDGYGLGVNHSSHTGLV